MIKNLRHRIGTCHELYGNISSNIQNRCLNPRVVVLIKLGHLSKGLSQFSVLIEEFPLRDDGFAR
jgi:hypothetical protein